MADTDELSWLEQWGRYRVPWFVTKRDEAGNPDFRVVELSRIREAVRFKLCWICGLRLGRDLAFCVGPMCIINRISAEPPQHEFCSLYAVRHCPFMSQGKARRPLSAELEAERIQDPTMIERNPGVTAVWVTKRAKFLKDLARPVFVMGKPMRVSWWAGGVKATRAQVVESMNAGYQSLRDMAEAQGTLDTLVQLTEAAQAYLPR